MFSHRFDATVLWEGGREHLVQFPGLEPLRASAARAFKGNAARLNPEQEMLAALSGCHLMSYLFHAERAGIPVVEYRDNPWLTLETRGTGGRITEATLTPKVTLAPGSNWKIMEALDLHDAAHRDCFIANSIAFPVTITAEILVAEQ